jgi:hypothetical protein
LGCFHPNICARKEKLKFESLWEECIQEETRVVNQEVLLARDDDQALAILTPKEEGRSPTSKRTLINILNSQTNSIIKNLIQEIFRREDNERKRLLICTMLSL